ncbi:MAG: pimeloyl-ACP methyl ester esterase BioH [Pseudomonadota bacterium]
MSLYHHTQGEGPAVVLLHGWGMHGGVWDDVVQALCTRFRVTVLDLPGHGRSTLPPEGFTLEAAAEAIAAAVPQPAVWVGWSLGGMLATRIASRHPAKVRALSLVASSPRFVQAEDWPHALPPEILAQFAGELANDYRATVDRFVALQAMGSRSANMEIRTLRTRLFRHGEPAPEALRGGLSILQTADLRAELKHLSCPVQAILGRLDTLTPARLGAALSQLKPGIETHIMPGAAHCPFLSHTREFLELLEGFLDRHAG